MFGYYLNLALRSLQRNKALTVLMILAIAVGIGASMTTLTVMQVLSGDPLPGKSAHIFYPQVDATQPKGYAHGTPLDALDYRSARDLWQAQRADRQTMLAHSQVKVTTPDASAPAQMLTMLAATSDFFPMFNVPFEYGNPWTAADGERHARVAVISNDLNNRLFGGKDSVGKTLDIWGHAVRIVGVLQPWHPSPRFYDVRGGRFANGDTAGFYAAPEDVFMPFSSSLEVADGHFGAFTCWGKVEHRGSYVDTPCAWVALWVELDSLAKVSAYRDFIAHYAQQQQALGRFANTETRMMSLMQWLDYNHVLPRNVKLQTWLAFAFLAICLFNTVGLLLAKFLRRGAEIGVRRALGATREAVFAQCLTEAGFIGFVGGIGGLLLTFLGLWLVRAQQAPYAELVHMDVAMFVVTFVLAVVVSLLAGMVPAFRASRITPALQLKTL